MAKRQTKRRDETVRLFAQRLRELRVQVGMTQAELARQASVSVTYVSQLESADAAPGIDLVARLAKALGTTAGDMMPASDAPDPVHVMKGQAKRLFDALLQNGDRETYRVLNPFLAHLAESLARRR